MKKIILSLSIGVISLFANINVDTTYATLGAITKKVGGDLVKVTILGSSRYDPHFIVPKPSLLAKLRRADLLIINGGGLEVGWLPPLIRNANNKKIQVGAKGFLDISHFVDMIDVPTTVSRAFGDVHAEGNPHYITDPHIVPNIAKAISAKLEALDPANRETYADNLNSFLTGWQTFLEAYDKKMQSCHTKKVVQYHELFNYFLDRYGIKNIGNIEPLPGIAPSSKHTLELINSIKKEGVKVILQDVYHEKKTAKFIAEKTGARVEIVPHEVGATPGSETLETFYNQIAEKICR